MTYTDIIEGVFSVFKRGTKGVYQHFGKRHLHPYLAEFNFRYDYRAKLGISNVERTQTTLCNIVGKHLTYRVSDQRTATQG